MGTRIRLDSTDFYFWGFQLQNKWLHIKAIGGNLSHYFEDNLLTNIAIYGAGALGRSLMEELSGSDTNVVYMIDRNAAEVSNTFPGITCLSFDADWPMVDAIVVTPIYFYEIRDAIREKIGCNTSVLAIDDIIDYCYEW
ncbi:hypothetical protein [Butyrivibrio sp. AE3004]|uniref:hypothetical protein n=1 Tax=Butyrivibrio sp. AE3004 TaxID=1506994 RepID=UPI000493C27D|nr:hypothetical protein [Butyrivibrio sp. AE3004]